MFSGQKFTPWVLSVVSDVKIHFIDESFHPTKISDSHRRKSESKESSSRHHHSSSHRRDSSDRKKDSKSSSTSSHHRRDDDKKKEIRSKDSKEEHLSEKVKQVVDEKSTPPQAAILQPEVQIEAIIKPGNFLQQLKPNLYLFINILNMGATKNTQITHFLGINIKTIIL